MVLALIAVIIIMATSGGSKKKKAAPVTPVPAVNPAPDTPKEDPRKDIDTPTLF